MRQPMFRGLEARAEFDGIAAGGQHLPEHAQEPLIVVHDEDALAVGVFCHASAPWAEGREFTAYMVFTPSTALTASRAMLTNRSTSASVMTSGGAKNRMSPGAGCAPTAGRVRVMTPRLRISALRVAANFISLGKFFFVARSSTNSTAASSPSPPRTSPACG